MFRVGPFGAGDPGAGRPAPGGRPGGDLSRLVVLAVAAAVVGVLALGFFMKGATGRLESAGGGPRPTREALRPAQPGEVQVRQVPDPGDPDADAPPEPAPGPGDAPAAGRKPPPFVENQDIYADVEQRGREIEPRALWHLMHKAVTADPVALHAEAKTIKFAQFGHDPDALVGRPVRFTGRLFQLAPAESEKFPADPMQNPSGVTEAVWGYVVDPGFKPCHFYAPALPAGIRTNDTLTIEGYFLKIYSFDNQSGNETQAPLLVVRNLWKEPPVTLAPIVWFGIPLQLGDHVLTVLEVVVLLGVLISIPIGLWYFRVERRQYAEYRQKAFERRRKGGPLAPATAGVAVADAPPAVDAPAVPPGDAPSPPAAP